LPEYFPAPLARSESELRIQERGRTEQGRRIVRVGNRRVVQPRRGPTPPPSYGADRHAALRERWCLRPDVIAEGEVAADIQPDLEQNGLPSTGGVWTQYVQGVSEEFYVKLRRGIGRATVSQSVDLGQNNNPNTTPTKDYKNVRVVVYLRGVQRGCAEEGERGSTPTG